MVKIHSEFYESSRQCQFQSQREEKNLVQSMGMHTHTQSFAFGKETWI